MKTLARSVGRTDIGGEPLPSVFKAFETGSSAIKRERQPPSSGLKREMVKARLRQNCCPDVGHGIDT